MAVDPTTLMRTARITTSLAARSFANEHRTSTAGSGIVSSTQGVRLKASAKISRVSGAASVSRHSASAYNRSSVKVEPGGCRVAARTSPSVASERLDLPNGGCSLGG